MRLRFLLALLGLALFSSATRPVYAQRKVGGQIVTKDPRSKTPQIVRFFIIRDSLVEISAGSGPDAPTVTVHPFAIRYLNQQLVLLDSSAAPTEERVEVGVDRGRLLLLFNRPLSTLALPVGVGLFCLISVGGALYFRRRLQHLRREQERQQAARRFTLAGREQERGRLAREIHDGPIQNLLALRMAPSGDGASDHEQTLVEVVRELRTVCEDLRPPTLADFGLEAGLASLARRLERQHPGLSVHLALDAEEAELDEFSRLTVFRVCQEAMNNAAVHGGAQNVRLTLAGASGTVTLTIQDDGRGFTLPSTWITLGEQGHFGMLGMHERADALGGRLRVESAPSTGATITLSVPLSPPLSGSLLSTA